MMTWREQRRQKLLTACAFAEVFCDVAQSAINGNLHADVEGTAGNLIAALEALEDDDA